jgi:lipopolysaccharide transport system ATP-binding protein
MTNDIAVRTVGLGKRYVIGGQREQFPTLRDTIAEAIKRPIERIRHPGAATHTSESLWALRDVDLEVTRGEVLAVIGPNGSGKSTLLKVLSRITEPTEGKVEVTGRVASLLEVGTGFHQELTGRENIRLNGAILGMSRAEIRDKFDEIVEFSEIGRFLDTPVKRYSSGMYIRLAFAVAANLDPDILIVDEVLAVGDAAFQKKCLGKMESITHQGRTVFFVSHNMGAVKTLCSRAVLLREGRVMVSGEVDAVVDAYLGQGVDPSQTGVVPHDIPRSGTGSVLLRELALLSEGGERVSQLYLGQKFRVAFTFEALEAADDAVVELGIATTDGARVASAFSTDEGQPLFRLHAGMNRVAVDVDITLLPRNYCFDVGLHHADGTTIDFVERVVEFAGLNVKQEGGDHYRWSSVRGYVRPLTRWQELTTEQATGPTAAQRGTPARARGSRGEIDERRA